MRKAASSAASALSGSAGGVPVLTVAPALASADWSGQWRRFAAQLDDSVMQHRLRQRGDANLCSHLFEEIRVAAEEVADVLTPLAETHVSVREPRAALVDDVRIDAHVEHAARVRDALVVEDVELGRAARRRHLVLDNLDLDAAADDVQSLLDRVDLADVHTHRGVELER